MDIDLAEEWCNAWEAAASKLDIDHSIAFWDVGELWIEEQRTGKARSRARVRGA